MNEQIESTGKTVDEAIEKGLKQLGTSRDEVEVKVLRIPTPRLFGLLGTKPAEVALIYSQDDKSQALRLTQEIVELMGVKAEVSAREVDDQIYIDIDKGGDILIGRRGRTLDSLQYLVSRIVNDGRDDWNRVVIDVEDYRNRRAETLKQLARKLVREAHSKKREIATEPMSARDRRIIHMALKQDKTINTFSVGRGQFRKVVIAPKNMPKKRRNDKGRRRSNRKGNPRRRKPE